MKLKILLMSVLSMAMVATAKSQDLAKQSAKPSIKILTTKFNPNEELKKYTPYTGKDLGLTYAPSKSKFNIWSPVAKSAMLNLYSAGKDGDRILTQEMKKGKNGTWQAILKGDYEGKFYSFQVLYDTIWLDETPDPYAVAVGVNGERAMVVDLKKTNPPGWDADKRPPLKSYADIILYELQLRDISVHPSSGIQHKGQYLGFTETGTKTPGGLSTGIDHLKDLGITHVHLMPAFDFRSIDETLSTSRPYNWGYDPQNYNTPEGSFATDPYDGRIRIREFKEMVKALHDNGLRVVLDVAYNHTGSTEASVFNRMVPFYYYRQRPDGYFSNATACGNEVASERPMVRKFMLESMLHWAKEYHVDGFRVDLMGIHDIETMNLIMKELRKIDPSIFVYGEGWTASESPFNEQQRAVKINTWKLDGIGVFSDEFRDGVKGHVFTPKAKGFINGETGLEESVKYGIVGATKHPQVDMTKVNYTKTAWASSPQMCINYVSCHDNHTLWDRLTNSCSNSSEADKLKMDKLAQTLVLTSQGVPFLLAGEEFVRTKFGVENSFNSPDMVNQIIWDNKEKYNDLFLYYQNLIKLRKAHPAFRMASAEQVASHIEFLPIAFDNIIGYVIKDNANGDSWKRILLIFNGNGVGKSIDIPAGNWKIICTNGRIEPDGMGTTTSTKAMLQPYSAYILAEE
ncbi:MAG: type I pullulanase [Bacteroidetes bacterium]|nr:type I pullulanase [Bacteroidota bacterium]